MNQTKLKALWVLYLLLSEAWTQHQVVFDKVGNIATAVSYGHLHLYLNISETEGELAKLSQVLTEISKASLLWSEPLKSKAKQFHHDLSLEIKDMEQEILDLQNFLRGGFVAKDHYHRNKRFIGLLMAMAAGLSGTFMGLYNAVELHKLQASLSDITTRQNHITDILQDHEVRLATVEKDIKSINITLHKIANVAVEASQQAYLNTVELRCLHAIRTIRIHIVKLRAGLNSIMYHRLAMDIVHAGEMNNVLERFKLEAAKKGYQLLSTSSLHLFQYEASFLYDEHGTHIIVHIPLVRDSGMLELYKYVPFPVPLPSARDQSGSLYQNMVLHLNAPHDYIGVDIISGHHKLLTHTELSECQLLGSTYFCRRQNVIHTNLNSSCLGALFTQQINTAHYLCPVSVLEAKEVVHQQDESTYHLYSVRPQNVAIQCYNGTTYPLPVPQGLYEINVPSNCRCSTNDHIFWTDIDIQISGRTIKIPTNWDARTLLRNMSLPRLEKILSDLQELGHPPSDVRDLKALYDLYHRDPVWWPHWISYVLGLLILFAICTGTFLLYRNYKSVAKRRKKLQAHSSPMINLNLLSRHDLTQPDGELHPSAPI